MHATRSDQIVTYLDRLTAYAQSRVADKELAADAVQEAITKAVKASAQLKDEEKLLPWLYAILRNTIAGLARRQGREIATADFAEVAAPEPHDDDAVCECFKPLIATLPSDYGDVLQALDLDETPRENLAAKMGISVLNLNVKLHRAREKLREAIESTCKMCAKHGCLNCTCGQ
ncbi:RNA polymerase sigma factor [Turneriella parva]|uniref:RNA polymerase, sigma-24 subunit, ECF subfamily n=1 Tax=Turneriella parva (strain ATCC BAA-1111 / DSM 21527 / NCTC 11395 / H) TaxID=869212 RepID=I4B6P2_TURPD|nr:sigma-70 family RNA polymerase sigma factor [Turneriella parva]AFM12949.1 RNA polymerase, sigma-24 subunit, ECF subfamily [Turneriella parva DSM 21527]